MSTPSEPFIAAFLFSLILNFIDLLNAEVTVSRRVLFICIFINLVRGRGAH